MPFLEFTIMTKKTIWFISKYYASPPNEGSGSSRAFLYMREFFNLGYNSIIFTSSVDPYSKLNSTTSKTEKKNIDNVDVWFLRGIKYKKSISLLRIFSWFHFEFILFRDYKLEKSIPDFIIISSPSILTIFNGLYLKYKYKSKLIFEVRDIWPLTIVEDAGLSRINPFIKIMGFIEWIAYKQSNGIVGTMPNLKQHVNKILGYDREVGFAPMGILTKNFRNSEHLDEKFIKSFIPNNKFLIIYAGTISVANALETLFSCANSLISQSEFHFVLVGDGPLLNEYVNKYSHLTNVTFVPKINKTQVQSLLSFADLLYFSVKKSEVWEYGQSLNKIIDYMLSEKPIIGSYSGFPSMIDESGCGSFVPAENVEKLSLEILRFKNMSHNERLIIGQKGRQWLMNYRNYDQLAKNYIQYIEEVF
jgi:hypothetical protein